MKEEVGEETHQGEEDYKENPQTEAKKEDR